MTYLRGNIERFIQRVAYKTAGKFTFCNGFCILTGKVIKYSPLLFIALLLFYLNLTQAQYIWQNPKPTGNDIFSVKFINDQVGWSVGNCGTILKTTDGGKEWLQVINDYTCDFTAVHPLDEQNIWIVGYGFSTVDMINDPSFKIINSQDGGKTWTTKLNGADFFCDPTCSEFGYLEDIYFINPFVGFVVGDSGVILKTSDGGINWELQQQSKHYHFKAIQFFNENDGLVTGGSGLITIGHLPARLDYTDDGIILRTSDGGETWETVFSDTMNFIDMFFRSQNLGWAVGVSVWEGGTGKRHILKTTDGGSNWAKQFEGDTLLYIPNLFFLDENNGYATGGSYGRVVKTTDGGKTWIKYYPAYYSLIDLFCFDTLHVITVGRYGMIFETTDGGESWMHRDTSSFPSLTISSIYFVNPDTCMFIQSEALYRTTDKGLTWENKGFMRVWDIAGYGKYCWAVGYGGTIMHSSDAGNSWIAQQSGVNAFLKDVKFVSSSVGWTAGDGYILKTVNGGSDWIVVRNETPSTGYIGVVAQDASRCWVYAVDGISVRTTSGGTTWYDCYTELDSMCAVSFINPDTGWARKNDALYITYNGGIDWLILNSGGVPYWKTQFVDVIHGWTFLSDGISATHNGGYKWRAEFFTKIHHYVMCAYLIDSLHGWVGAFSGGLIRYGYPELITSVPIFEISTSPNILRLHPNYPNPFNASTLISYQLKSQSIVTIRICDILGKEVRVLENSEKSPGSYNVVWDGRNDERKEVSSGVYFYRLNVLPSYFDSHNPQFVVKKMMLIK